MTFSVSSMTFYEFYDISMSSITCSTSSMTISMSSVTFSEFYDTFLWVLWHFLWVLWHVGRCLSTFQDSLSVPSSIAKQCRFVGPISCPRNDSNLTSRPRRNGTVWLLKVRLLCCPEKSVTNYKLTPRNIPEERRHYWVVAFLVISPANENRASSVKGYVLIFILTTGGPKKSWEVNYSMCDTSVVRNRQYCF